ncbi:MAG: hypothetical protein KUG77_02690 [Nannocystaceae bacterium]|nr:hypothetical protein [Nannocystaceae bacterium]
MRWLLLAALAVGCGGPREPREAPTAAPPAATPDVDVEAEGPLESPVPAAAAAVVEPELPRSVVPQNARMVAMSARPGLIAFSGALQNEGSLWVGQLRGNGGRDTVIFVPPGVRADQPFEWVVHFHGTYSENIAEPHNGAPKKSWVGWDRLQQSIEAVTELQSQGGNNVALLYPVSSGKRMEPEWKGWSNKMYDRMWMTSVAGDPRYIDDFEGMVDQATEILESELGVPKLRVLPRVIAEGHSAGGIALRNVAVSGTERVKEYLFLDASFQDWADGCFAAVSEQQQDALVTLVITQGGIADPFGKRDPWCDRLEGASQSWPEIGVTCTGHPERRTGFGKLTCETHEDAAKAWPDYASWCQGMKDDMTGEPGVFVFRTKVPHGKQPRHFVGGLELPADRP